MRDDKMGSQTLEILRQGVWASLTGGWFYDPHQDIFCNTFHLYIWLFLLCFPFTIYVYFPPKTLIWYLYCIIVAGLVAVIKILNYALHRMYDTTECIKEETEDELDAQKREEEGIELQVLSNKSVEENLNTTKPQNTLLSYVEAAGVQSTDADSMESIELLHLDAGDNEKLPGTIDLKAEVHRKNSSESSEDQIYLAALTAETMALKKQSNKGNKRNHQRSKTDSYVNIYVKHERPSSFKKQPSEEEGDESLETAEGSYSQKTFVNIESEAGPSRSDCRRRHSNFTNSTLNIHPSIAQEIKATGSFELGFIDKNQNQDMPSDGFYFQPHSSIGVRRIRSTALETSCPAPSLTVHPNSLEIIGCKSRNPLPPPSTTLVRNQHLNLCPYYGSEIVYPIAEQSDEHQTSQGPDSDQDSVARNSDSDYEECGRDRSPYLYVKLGKLKKPVPCKIRYQQSDDREDENEAASANSKDMLLSEEPSVVEVQVDDQMNNIECIIVSSGDPVDKRSSDSASNTSLECREIVVQKPSKSKTKSSHRSLGKDAEDAGYECRHQTKKKKKRSEGQSHFYDTEGAEVTVEASGLNPLDESGNSGGGNRSSLVKLDLDWLFGEETENQESAKTDGWANSSAVSLEQDVSKLLQETVLSTRSLGAIPKKSRGLQSSQSGDNSGRKTPKSESDKCSKCRSKMDVEAGPSCSRERGRHSRSRDPRPDSVERVECYVLPATGLRTINFVPRRENRQLRSSFEDSSSSTSRINELSTLLPSTPLLSAFLASRRDIPLALCLPTEKLRLEHAPQALKRRRMSKSRGSRARRGPHERRRGSQGTTQQGVDVVDEAEIHNAPNDSSLEKTPRRCCDGQSSAMPLELWESSNEDKSAIREMSPKTPINLEEVQRRHNQRTQFVNCLSDSLRRRILTESNSDTIIINTSTFLNEENFHTPVPTFKFIRDDVTYPKVKSYYKFRLLPKLFVKVTFDRLKLLALLDRNLTLSETFISITLSVLVALLGALLLYLDFYKDIPAFIFCFVMASCQYSLLKSVQPDAASPMHGFNRIISYSRPIYFCMCSILVLSLHYYLSSIGDIPRKTEAILVFSKDFLATFILFFPLWFSLGLFPQIDTFVMYFLEQIDMHVFGGNAMSSLLGSLYCIFRSVVVVLMLVGPAYGGLSEKKGSQHASYSIFCAVIVATSYHLSRCTSDPSNVWNIVKKHLWPPDIYREHSKYPESEKKDVREDDNKDGTKETSERSLEKTEEVSEHVDPLPKKLQKTVNGRLKNDIIICSLISIFVFGIHSSTVFTVLQPELSPVLWSVSAGMGLVLHYIIPQLRKQLPWTCIARPVLRSFEYGLYEIKGPSRIMWFERIYVYLCFIERNIIYPLLFVTALTEDGPKIEAETGPLLASFIVTICGLKCLRSSYSNQNIQYLVVIFTALAFKYDYKEYLSNFLVTYFFMGIVYHKIHELLLKVQFVVTYIAPWQITWGSAFHAFAQPFSVPHSAMLFLQAIISAVLSTPLNPFLGSAIFLTSYVRPIKFWERNYNTRRVDHSNTPLSSHLERNLGADDNNLNSIFYEHLTRSLQHSLCGDLALGRWGLVNQGDCFVLASDYLNCLVHIIEVGNGLVTFQVRGLEFRGTYCQQREVEAITEGVEENDGCCCCDTGHLPNMLSVNAAFSQRWLAWEVTAAKYVLEGYSISDNSAISMFQVFEFRRVLVSYYVKSIIYYTVRSAKLEDWLNSQAIMDSLQPMQDKQFVDLDPVFNFNIDEDFDINKSGMTKPWFLAAHGEWIRFCVEKFGKKVDSSRDSALVLLCFALSLLGRRTLGAVSHNTQSSVEFFLYGLHALFKGDFRITCSRDEWVFNDIDLLKTVVAPGIRMSLKLHQDHFMSPDEYEEPPALFEAITKHQEELVISHEGDPAWRNAVLSGTPSLLALRHVLDDGTDEYKIIMLNKRYLSFRVIKINRECVRGLWAGQQQELVYLRNRNPERGSIQNAKQALRNIINSSCDQPIGYPIYVSPLTTSYADTNDQYCSLVGGSVTLQKIQNSLLNLFRRIRKRCGEGCSSGASTRDEIGMGNEGMYAMTPVTTLGHHNSGSQSCEAAHLSGSIGRGSSLGRGSLGANRGSLVSMGKPTSSTLANLAGIFKEKDERSVSQAPDGQARPDERQECDSPERDAIQKVMITDPNFVYDGINLGRRIDVLWPTEYMRIRGGRSYWNSWAPEAGMEGYVVHKWTPSHRDPSRRSHVDRTILLVQIEDKFIPIAEQGVKEVQVDP
ncbi:pecanex-like protein 1 [Coccinella septempunctata]|uniref:pecanex-like protein 1 n=1 Tax=Coccinella septempunctata TaxID=41139 RepID=UPI001D06DB96|nr:pecanex-like protein 1 [Coccinella septempunctata]